VKEALTGRRKRFDPIKSKVGVKIFYLANRFGRLVAVRVGVAYIFGLIDI